MSSLVITVKSNRTQATLNDRLRLASSRSPDAVANLAGFFHGAAGGFETSSISVQSSAADPVLASQTATIVFGSLTAAVDTITIAGQAIVCSAGAPVGAQFQKLTDGTVTAANLATAINAHATLSQLVWASSSAAVVTVSALVPGIIGNLVTVVTAAAGITVGGALLAGGAGGATNAPITYARGL